MQRDIVLWMKSRVLMGGLLGCLLSACSNDQLGSKDLTDTLYVKDAIENDASTKKSMRTITDALSREVEIPNNPSRILALSELDVDACLALGIKPLGILNGRGQNSAPRYLGDSVSTIKILGNLNQPNLDQILMLEPDLILVGGYSNKALVNQLQMIAPTVSTYHVADRWDQAFKNIAELIQKNTEYETFMYAYQQQIKQFKKNFNMRVQEATASVVRWNPKGPSYMYQHIFAMQVLQDLGFTIPKQQDHPINGAHSPALNLESLNMIDADWLFIGTLTSAGEAVDAMQQMTNMPVFQQLTAVKNQHYAIVDGSLWTSIGGPLAAKQLVGKVSEVLSNAP